MTEAQPATTPSPQIVGVRFQKIGKLYHFDATKIPDLKPGDYAIVETSRGVQIGQVVQRLDQPPQPQQGSWKAIERKASESDLQKYKDWQKKEVEAMIDCRAAASEMKYEGVKIVKGEFTFDGRSLTFLYNTEGEEELDLGKLQKEMQQKYDNSNGEVRLGGPRVVAKMLGGVGSCGLDTRCCSMFLTEFSPISIKMAKEQGISLNPAEITGMCGRLRCCLIYEFEQYVAARKTLPKRGKEVGTPFGQGQVVDVLPLKESVLVQVDERIHEVPRDAIQPLAELQAVEQKAASP